MSPLDAPLQATYWGSPHGVTTFAHELHSLWDLNYYIALPISAVVLGGIVWCLVRYRARPGETRRPRQFQYHIPIEATYTIIPLVLVAVIFGYMYGIENDGVKLTKHPALVVNVQGFQWGWRFTYPNGHQQVGSVASQPNINSEVLPVLYLPTNVPVQLDLRSDDVNHSFYVKEFLYKRDLIQGINNDIDVTITTPGRWFGECTQLCGVFHAYMRFEVVAEPVARFDAWYRAQKPNTITYYGETAP